MSTIDGGHLDQQKPLRQCGFTKRLRCICGAQQSTVAFPVADWNFSNVTETGLMHRCSACDSQFPDQFPNVDTISHAYQNYYTVSRNRSLVGRTMHALLEKLQGLTTTRGLPEGPKRVLDFGCGSGAWLGQMKAFRPELDLSGTDIIRPDIQSLPFRWIASAELSIENASFDWITLSHVLEHLLDPQETLRELVDCLAPGGAIWIATPNAQSYLFSSMKGRARDADFPRHRQIFSRKALNQLLKDCGRYGSFENPPRINSVLNLRTCLASRTRPPFLPARPIVAARPIADTLSHLLLGHSQRKENAPEHILVARRLIDYKATSSQV